MKLYDLLAILIWHKHNIQMIHWNVVGKGFKNVHEATDGYVEELENHIDSVAEFIRMLDLDSPLPSFPELYKTVQEDPVQHVLITSKPIDSKTAWNALIDIFDDLMKSCQSVYESVPTDIQSELDLIIYFYRKEGMFKCKATVRDID